MTQEIDRRIDVVDVAFRAGLSRRVSGTLALGDFDAPLMRIETPIVLDIALEGILDGLVVAGTVTAEVALSCRGCLAEDSRRIEVTVQELFESDPADDGGETYPIEDLEIDLDQMVRDAILLAVPESPTFCDGPLEECVNYQRMRAAGGVVDSQGDGDDRWAALNDLFGAREQSEN